ncbi:MAG: nucleotidyltransferase domain-containing protein [Planctomycetes bacterium]|nr:nucleotidyltransferase domain-containing protein [Planctomycetota bacterium]
MISQNDIKVIKELSSKYVVGKVILFGSSLDPQRESTDIDIAIEGVAPKDYYQYCSDLTMSLSKPVDIVDLSVPCKFVDIILEEGVVLYG